MKIAGYETHPAADLFPLMEGRELADLVEDIREHGLLNPIVLVRQDGEDLVLDGRNRLRACGEAGVVPIFEVWSGKGSPTDWVVSQNLHRRHLDESQRAMVGAGLVHLYAGEARENMAAGGKGSQICETLHSTKRAAAAVNVSPRSVDSAVQVSKHGAAELVEAVKQGQVAVSTAALIADQPIEDQREIVARGEDAIRKAAKEIEARRKAERHADLQAKIAEEAAFFNAHPEHVPADAAAALLALWGAMYAKNGRSA